MPAPIKHKTTETYCKFAEEARAHNETNDCAVKAVAIAAGKSYAEVHAALAARGRKSRQGTYTGQIIDALRDLGFTAVRVDQREIIKRYPKSHQILKCVTTHHPDRFAAQWPQGTYLLFTASHVGTVVDGVNHDWTRGKAKRVQYMYKVIPTPAEATL